MEEAHRLLEKFRRGECTSEELVLLYTWFENLKPEHESSLSEEEIRGFQSEFKRKFFAQMTQDASPQPDPAKQTRTRLPYVAWFAAASVLLFLSLGLLFRNHEEADVPPGEHKAVLTLANGKKIYLSDQELGTSLSEGGLQLIHRDTGLLVYEPLLLQELARAEEPMYNLVETPIGGTFGVLLPDSTMVWLNSSTRIRYALPFNEAERMVELLEGEAYFQVRPRWKKDGSRQAFHVRTGDELVEVLGTEFNISAYPGERRLTTLIEGAVQISNRNSSHKTLLTPGHQVYYENGRARVEPIDPESVYAWKAGYFLFDDEPLEEIMRKVARWYDLSVEYGPGVDKQGKFWGSVSRFENVSILLEKLELTGAVKFQLKGRRVLVMK